MKNVFFASMLSLTLFSCSGGGGGGTSGGGAAATWRSVQVGINPGAVNFSDIATDSSGNIYVVGSTSGTLANAPIGTMDAVLSKYNSVGQHEWTQQWGIAGAFSDLNTIALDSSGNIFVGGRTEGNLSGDGLNGTRDAYVAKLDNEGTLLWDHQFGDTTTNTGTASVNALSVDSSGNLYFTGDYTDNFLGQASVGPTAGFVMSRDSAGLTRWHITLPYAGATTNALGISWSEVTSKVYVVGATHQLFPGPGTAASQAAYLLTISDVGAAESIVSLNTAALSFATDVAVADTGNVYVAGVSLDNINGETVPSSTGSAFLVKYDSSLNEQWTKFLGQGAVPGPEVASSFGKISIDSTENIYAVGSATGEILGHSSPSDGAIDDILVAKYTSAGTLAWSNQYGTTTDALYNGAIAIGSTGHPFVSAVTVGDFDNNPAVGTLNNGVIFQLDKSEGLLK